jgi:DNA-binding NarL/FixJ family response regulator
MIKGRWHHGGGPNKYRNHFSWRDEIAIKRAIERGAKIADVAAELGRSYGSIKAHANRVMKVQFRFPPKRAA